MNLDPQIKHDLAEYLEKKLLDRKNEVTVISSYPLEKDELDLIQKKLPILEKAHLKNVVDTSIIAGIILNFGSKTIDLSLAHELQQLQSLFI